MLKDTCCCLNEQIDGSHDANLVSLSDPHINRPCVSILEHKNRKILEQLEEQKKRLRMQAQGPGTATAGASRFVG